jgi:hypothetical protein
MATKKTQRLSIDMPIEWHTELKIIAAKYNVSIRQIVNTLILEKLTLERSRDHE